MPGLLRLWRWPVPWFVRQLSFRWRYCVHVTLWPGCPWTWSTISGTRWRQYLLKEKHRLLSFQNRTSKGACLQIAWPTMPEIELLPAALIHWFSSHRNHQYSHGIWTVIACQCLDTHYKGPAKYLEKPGYYWNIYVDLYTQQRCLISLRLSD